MAIFAYLLQRGQEAGVDIDTIIQAYNFGASYIDYVAARGGEHELAFAQTLHPHDAVDRR